MPKMQVYLAEDLYRRVKAARDALNVSAILQAALEEALAELERQRALGELVRDYEAKHGAFTSAQLAEREALDQAAARRPRRGRPRRRAA